MGLMLSSAAVLDQAIDAYSDGAQYSLAEITEIVTAVSGVLLPDSDGGAVQEILDGIAPDVLAALEGHRSSQAVTGLQLRAATRASFAHGVREALAAIQGRLPANVAAAEAAAAEAAAAQAAAAEAAAVEAAAAEAAAVEAAAAEAPVAASGEPASKASLSRKAALGGRGHVYAGPEECLERRVAELEEELCRLRTRQSAEAQHQAAAATAERDALFAQLAEAAARGAKSGASAASGATVEPAPLRAHPWKGAGKELQEKLLRRLAASEGAGTRERFKEG